MEVIYHNKKVELQCTNLKEANKLFGGNKELIENLFKEINLLMKAPCLKDVIGVHKLRFHLLIGNKAGLFSIDIKTRREPWRLILQPLNEEKKPYKDFRVDQLCSFVKIVKIMEVSKHYE